MNPPSPRRIPPSLALSLVTIAIVGAFFGATLYASGISSRIDAMAEAIAGNADPSIRYLGAARTELHEMARVLTTSVLDGRSPASLRRDLDAHEQAMRRDLDAYASFPFFPTEWDRWQVVRRDLRDMQAKIDATVGVLEAGDVKEATERRAGPVAQAIGRADAALDGLIAFDADQGTRLGDAIGVARRRAERIAFALDALAGVLAFALGATAVASTRQQMRSMREAREADQRAARRVRGVAEAAVAISESVARGDALRDVLQVAVDRARTVASADLAAVGVGQDPSRRLDPFRCAGMAPAIVERLGAPRPRGVLGVLAADRRPLRIDDLRADPRFEGLPEGHPPLGPFLGISARSDQEIGAQLYLGRKPGAAGFSEEDVGVVQLLAEFVANATQNATLHASLRDEVRAREDVLSMVSHDLRNPLSAMSMAAAIAQRTLGDGAPARRHVDVIARNAARMDRLIGDLLTAAKLHEGKLSVEPAAQDAASLVGEVVETFAEAAASKKIGLEVDVANDVPPVSCDSARIGQVLSNLIGNALKFTKGGDRIVVSVGRCPGADGEVLFSVRDTGIGIAADVLPHVFDRYWQTREHAARGTGLGLFICKGLVEAHRGRIWVTSRLGEGSDFQFTLPAAGEPPAPPRGGAGA